MDREPKERRTHVAKKSFKNKEAMRRYGCTCFLGDLSPLALAMNSDVVTEHLVLGGAPSPLLEFLPGAA